MPSLCSVITMEARREQNGGLINFKLIICTNPRNPDTITMSFDMRRRNVIFWKLGFSSVKISTVLFYARTNAYENN